MESRNNHIRGSSSAVRDPSVKKANLADAFKCLYGYTPFYAGNRSETRQKILVCHTTLINWTNWMLK